MQAFMFKPQFYAEWNRGLLWNKPRTWRTFAEAITSDFPPDRKVAIRYVGPKVGGANWFITDLYLHQVEEALKKVCCESGQPPEDFNISEQMCPELTRYLINGYIMRNESGLELYFSEENTLMRPALASSGCVVRNVRALQVLRRILWPTDYDELMATLDLYPDHVVEFSGFDRCIGIIPGRRMIIWEVRLY